MHFDHRSLVGRQVVDRGAQLVPQLTGRDLAAGAAIVEIAVLFDGCRFGAGPREASLASPFQVEHIVSEDMTQPRSKLPLRRPAKGGQIAQGFQLGRLHDVRHGVRQVGFAGDLFVGKRPRIGAVPLQERTDRLLRALPGFVEQSGQLVFR